MSLLTAASLLFVLAGEPAFREQAIRAHMSFLAHDLLEGRGTGTRGYRIAAEYVAAQYDLIGLEPGANGSWFQEIPFRKTVPGSDSTVTLMPAGGEPVTLRAFDTFVTQGDPQASEKTVEAEVVFAGFGITAPTQHYDDYANLDVRGKIVAVFNSAPQQFPNAVRAHFSSSQVKIENAAARRAAGIIFLRSPAEDQRAPWPRVVRQNKLGSMFWVRADGTLHGIQPNISSPVTLGVEATRTLFGSRADEVLSSVEAGRPKPSKLPLRAKIHITSTHESVKSPNVIGILRGSDPALRDEYIVYSSHLDHLGITEAVDGDSINNGALDNASGIAVTLEIARAFASLPKAPRRSIIFLATTAEEKGLKGAEYFANNPTVPFEGLAGNINIDMLMLARRTTDFVVYGAETNDLGDLAAATAREMGSELSPEPFPDEVIFVRSDQYPFVKRGVPAIFIDSGYKSVEPGIDIPKEEREWLRTRYHGPKDDLSQPIDYSAALPLAELSFRLGLAAANRDQRPKWKPGDFFGETFGRK